MSRLLALYSLWTFQQKKTNEDQRLVIVVQVSEGKKMDDACRANQKFWHKFILSNGHVS